MGRSRTSGRSSNGSGGSVFNSAKAIAAASNKKTKPSKAGKNVKNRDTEVQDDVYSYKPRLDKSAKRVKRAGDETRKNLKESDERKGGMDWDDEKLAVANELGVGNVKFRVGMDTDDEDEDVEQEDEDAVETAKGKGKGKAVKRGRDETGEDDDEEIDSDEAWGEGSESDEEEDGQDKASTSKVSYGSSGSFLHAPVSNISGLPDTVSVEDSVQIDRPKDFGNRPRRRRIYFQKSAHKVQWTR